jgi:hypothetical protein
MELNVAEVGKGKPSFINWATSLQLLQNGTIDKEILLL